MKKKNLKTGKRAPELKRGKPVRVQRLVRQIADRLFTVSFGTKDAEKGTRLAVMKGTMPHETHLGGWCRSAVEREIEDVLVVSQRRTWKTYPMGAAATERMERRGMKAHLSHAVEQPCNQQNSALCGVLTFSLCMDDSLATDELPDCPKCRRKLAND